VEILAPQSEGGQQRDSFETVLRQHSRLNERGWRKEIETEGRYVYGGLKALLTDFAAVQKRLTNFVLTPAGGKFLAVFHAT
jgi:hypothetical protein